MVDPNVPASVRIRASECVLNHAAKAIGRRLAKLEDRFAPRIAMPDGWAKEELLKRLGGISMRLLPEDRELEGHAAEAVQQRLEEWLSAWRQRRDRPSLIQQAGTARGRYRKCE